jgi:DNA polymerase-3 subunit epsilon/exodeoxyribonuclease X
MLIFLDLQTTGRDRSDAICSISLLHEEHLLHELINEGKKIPSEASSLHNITNEMIADSAAFNSSETYRFLQADNNAENILVTHHSAFHLEMLDVHGISWQGEIIDTMRVTKHLLPECERFDLAFLRYDLQLYKQEESLKLRYGIKCALVAHEGKSSLLLTKLLFTLLLEMASVEKMQELSCQKVLLSKLPFGKYQGKYIEEIMECERGYLEWMLSLADLDEDLRYSLEYYLQG